MVDQQKNSSPDDEYQFPQEEYIASGGADASQQSVENEAPVVIKKSGIEKITSALFSFFQHNKRIVIVVMVVFFGYLLLHFGLSKKEPIQPPQPVVSTPVQQPNNTAVIGSLNALQAHSSRTASDIKNLQSQISDLQGAVNQAQSDNQQLRDAMNTLSEQVKGISAQLDKIVASGVKAKNGPKIIYHLRAVIPDRAWIISNTGRERSVTVGNEVRGYGKITAIYSQRGIVTTTSGRNIKYGPNDY